MNQKAVDGAWIAGDCSRHNPHAVVITNATKNINKQDNKTEHAAQSNAGGYAKQC